MTSWRIGDLSPRGALDELEPLREVVGDARVVAVGEAAHGQAEYHDAHFAVLRFLVERLGFTVLALESGFSEGQLVDRFVTGALEGDPLSVAWHGMTYGMGAAQQMADRLAWMREHNRRAAAPVRYVGTDLPGGCGAVGPALVTVRSTLAPLDPALAALVARVERAVGPVDDQHAAAASLNYAALRDGQRDAITLALAALHSRVATLAPTYRSLVDPELVATVLHELDLALWLDRHWRWMHGDPTLAGERVGDALVAGMPRDAGMAATVQWLLSHRPRTRMLLVASNGHVQRIASAFGTTAPLAPCGAHLADALGPDYVSIGLTAQRGETVSLVPDVAAPGGFQIVPTPLPEPEAGSVETALAGADGPVLRDLRRAPVGADRLRNWESFRTVDVDRAHDAVIVLPSVGLIERPPEPPRMSQAVP